jgi:hypothetical protein
MQTYGCTDAMLKNVLTMLAAESTYCTTPCAKLKKTIATLNTAFMYATSGSKVQHRFDKNTGTLDDDDNQTKTKWSSLKGKSRSRIFVRARGPCKAHA